MVYTPRRRRLLRAIFVGLIFTGCVLLFERWNVSGPPVSNHDPRIAKYVHDPLGNMLILCFLNWITCSVFKYRSDPLVLPILNLKRLLLNL
jgi:hypothetical protein